MNVTEIRGLYDYTDWANDRMIAAIRGLSDEQYTREITSSFPSVRATLGHIAGAEWIWLQRWKGTSPAAQPEWAVDAPVDLLANELRKVASERQTFLRSIDDEALMQPLGYRNLKGDTFTNRLIDILSHVANHSTHHRGQLTTMLRQAGAVPPVTDLIVFFREKR